MLATLVEDGQLRSNPCTGVRVNRRRPDEDEQEEPEVKAMTRDELARLMAALPAEWRLFFELLVKMGLRISEALGLDWPDIEFAARPVFHVRRQYYRGKVKRLKSSNGKRDLPLPAVLARALWAARPARDRPGVRDVDRHPVSGPQRPARPGPGQRPRRRA